MSEPKVHQAHFVDPNELRLDRLISNCAQRFSQSFDAQIEQKTGINPNTWQRGLGSVVDAAIQEAGVGAITPVGLARSIGLLGPEKKPRRTNR